MQSHTLCILFKNAVRHLQTNIYTQTEEQKTSDMNETITSTLP